MIQTATKIPLFDLSGQFAQSKSRILAEIETLFDSQQFILGKPVSDLEETIAAYCGTEHGVGMSSGTDALLAALMALDIGHGDEIITTPFTFFATAGSIARVGAKPVFVDIDPMTFLIDADKIEEKISKKTKAIMPVHLYGQMANMEKIMELAKRHKLAVVEDAAQAIGATQIIDGKTFRAGSVGDIGCFSFYPTKNLGGAGDAGMSVTHSAKLAEKMKLIRNHGSKSAYHHLVVGANFRLDAVQAVVLNVKFPDLEGQNSARRVCAKKYDAALSGAVTTPFVEEGNIPVYNLYTIRTRKRAALQKHLSENNIGNGIYYPMPMHLQPCFDYLGGKKGDFPEAEKACEDVLSIPMFAGLKSQQQEKVIEKIKEFMI